jgi:hypothetical protein
VSGKLNEFKQTIAGQLDLRAFAIDQRESSSSLLPWQIALSRLLFQLAMIRAGRVLTHGRFARDLKDEAQAAA